MASVLCSKCKQGIHYHGAPEGIQFYMIAVEDWSEITTIGFNPNSKVINPETGYPKLYRTDTLEEDFPDKIQKFWKCPHCGSLLFFDDCGKVIEAYEIDEKPNDNMQIGAIESWCFDDYQWDELTESCIANTKINESLYGPNKLVKFVDGILLQDATKEKMYAYKRIK